MAVLSLKYKTKQGTLTAPAEIDLGAMIPLATTTLSTTTATIEFTSIPQAYEHLQIRLFARTTGGNIQSYASIQFNSDTTGSNYYSHYIQGDGSSISAGPNASNSIHYDIAGANATASVFGAIVFDILDYANTNKYKTTRALGGTDNNGNGRMNLTSGLWINTSAITSIRLTPFAGSFAQYSHAALYGIKRAGA
jgi:hypothetical protein